MEQHPECPQGFERTQLIVPLRKYWPSSTPQRKEGFTGVPPNCDLVAPQDLAVPAPQTEKEPQTPQAEEEGEDVDNGDSESEDGVVDSD